MLEVTRAGVEDLADRTMRLIRRVCDAWMPKRASNGGRKRAYWWTDDIAELRRKDMRLRRRAQRIRKKGDIGLATGVNMDAKQKLKIAIKNSK